MSRLALVVAAQGGGASDVVTRESMTARLQSIVADAEVPEAIQDQLAVAGLTTLGLFASMGSDDKASASS